MPLKESPKGPRIKDHRGIDLPSYFKNLSSSVKAYTVDQFEEMMPVVKRYREVNKGYTATEFKNQLKEGYKVLKGMVSSDTQYGKTLIKNLKEDLKSGKFYNKERIKANEAKGMFNFDFGEGENGEDFNLDFDMNMGDDNWDSGDIGGSTDDEGRSSKVVNNRQIINNFAMGGLAPTAQMESTKILGNTIARSTAAQINFQSKILNTMNYQNAMYYKSSLNLFNMMNSNIGSLIEGVNSLGELANQTAIYQDNSLKIQQDILDIQRENLDILKSIYMKEDKSITEPEDEIIDSDGTINMKAYMKSLNKEKFFESLGTAGALLQMPEMFRELGIGWLENMKGFNSPLMWPIEQLFKKVVGPGLRNSFKGLSTTLQNMTGSLLLKMGEGVLGDKLFKGDGIFNKILRTTFNSLGRFLGIQAGGRKDARGKLVKEATPFDTYTRKAIIHVIPTLLSKILSAVSGTPELAVNYEEGGRLVTKAAVKRDYEQKKQEAATDSFYEQISDIEEKLDAAKDRKDITGKEYEDIKANVYKLFQFMGENGVIYDPNSMGHREYLQTNYGIKNTMLDTISGLYESMPDELKMSLGKNVIHSGININRTIKEMENESADSAYGQLFMDMDYTPKSGLSFMNEKAKLFESNKERDKAIKEYKANPKEFIKKYGDKYGLGQSEALNQMAILSIMGTNYDTKETPKEGYGLYNSYAAYLKDNEGVQTLASQLGTTPSTGASISRKGPEESVVELSRLQDSINLVNQKNASFKLGDEEESKEPKEYKSGPIGRTSRFIDETNESAKGIIQSITDTLNKMVMGIIYDDPNYSGPERKNIFQSIKDKFTAPAKSFAALAKRYWTSTKETVKEKWTIFKDAFKEAAFGKDGKGGIVNVAPIKEFFSNAFKGVKTKASSIFTSFKDGFIDAFKTGKTKNGIIDFTPLKNFGSELKKFVFGEEDRKVIFERLKKSFKEKGKAFQVVAGSGIGIVASLFLPGGPIVGALLGGITPLVVNFKKLKDTLFGKDSKFRQAMNRIKMALTKSNVLAGAASGGVVGGVIGLFVGQPTLGALAGSIVGAMTSLLVSTKNLKEKLFGSEGNDTGVFSRWLVTRAKRFLPTAAMGLLGASIGPFGLFGGVALAALAETTSFKRFLWGSKGKDGKKKQMGIFDLIKNYFRLNMTLPFKAFMARMGNKLRHDLARNIGAPFKHLGRTINLVFKSQLDRLGRWFRGTRFFGIIERGMHTVTSMVTRTFGFIRGALSKLFGPVTSLISKGIGKAFKGIAGILSLGISEKYKGEYEESKTRMKAEEERLDERYKKGESTADRYQRLIEYERDKIRSALKGDRDAKRKAFKLIGQGADPNDVLGEPDTPQLAEMRASTTIEASTNEEIKKQTPLIQRIRDFVKEIADTIKEKANKLKDDSGGGTDQSVEAPPADGAGRGLFKGIIPNINSLGRGKISSLIGGAVKGIGGFFLNKGKNLLSRGFKAVKDFFLEGGWRRMAKKSLKTLLNVATLGMYKKVTNAWNRFKMEDERGISANEQTVTDPIAYVLEKMDIIIKHLGLLTNLDPMAECAEQTAKKVTEVANNTNDLEEQLLNVENAITTQTQVSAVGNAVEGVGSLLSAGGAVAKGGSLLGKAGPLLGKAGSLLGAGGSLIGKIGAGAKALSALGGAGSLLGAGGSALGSLGAILTGPIGMGLLAAAGGAYATYKGYKWYKKRKAEKAAEEQNKEAVEANINPAILNSGAITREQLEAAGLIKEQKKKKTVPNELGGNAYLEYLNTAGAPVATGRGPLSQLDPAIAGMDYSASGEKDSVGMAGCSPVSLYNAMSNMGSGLDPYSVINESKQYKVKGSGTSHSGLAQVAKLHGYNLNSSTSNFGSKIDQALTSGGQSLVVGVGNEATSPFTPAGHTINIAGETGNDYIVSNPLHSGYEVWDKRAIDNNAMKVLSLSSSGRGEEPSTTNKEGEPVSDKPENARTVDKAPLLEKIRSLFRIANNLRPDNINGLHPLLLQKLVAYGEMFNEQKGRKPLITSAYRTRQDQTRIAGQSKKGMAAKPGTSKHEWGLAVDVNTADVDPSMIAGFGLSRPLLNLKAGKEPWHIEPMEWASKKTTQAKTIAEQMGGLTNASVTYNADMAKSIDTASSFQVDGKTGLINTASAIGSAASGMASGLAEIIKNALEQVFSIIGGTISKFKGTSDDSGKPYASSGSKSSASKPDSKAGIIKGSEATGDKKQFIESVTSGALKGYETGRVLPSLTVAQAALESGWGKKGIGNNLFGIKASKGWTGATRDVVTHEYDKSGRKYQTVAKFRDYPSIEEGIIDHTKFLQGPRYQKAGLLDSKEFYEATTRVKNAGYATDPKYPELLNKIISGRKIQVLDKAALEGNFSTTYAQALEKYGDSLGQGPSVMSIVPLLASKAVKDGVNRIKTNQVLNKVKKDNLKANVKRTPTAFESISDVPRIDPNVENRATYEASTKKALEEIKLGQQQQVNQAPTMNNEEIVKALYLILDAIKEKEFKVDASELANNVNEANNNSGNTTGNRNARNNTGRYNPNNRRQSFYNDNPADRGFSPFSPINNEYMQEVGLIAAGRGLLGF